MPSTWMGMVPPLTWQTAHWPATPRTTVSQTPCGAALGGSPPSCVSTSPSVSLRTAAGTGWALPMAGVGLAVTPWCANRPPAVPTVSVHRMAVRVMLDGEGRTAAKDPMICEECALSSFGNYAALTGARVTLFTVAAAAPLVSMANPVNKSIPWVCTGWTVGRSASARTCAHVTRSQEAATPCSRERRTTAYMGPPVTPAPALSTSSCTGHCLANQMFAKWREETHKYKPFLSEQRLLIVTGLLTSLLLASLVGHLIKMSGASGSPPRPRGQLLRFSDRDQWWCVRFRGPRERVAAQQKSIQDGGLTPRMNCGRVRTEGG